MICYRLSSIIGLTLMSEKERNKKSEATHTFWLFGIHAVRDALKNPKREKIRLLLTRNAERKLENSIEQTGIKTEIVDPKKFNELLDRGSVHQGAALEVKPLLWGNISDTCGNNEKNSVVLLLDRISDPHNVGAILRSAEVFGVQAVIGTQRHSAPETGALAKSASGTLERQPYLRVNNLSRSIEGINSFPIGPMAFILGAEGPGLRDKTKLYCDMLVKVPSFHGEGSLNVSNAAIIALYDIRHGKRL
jgi:23S rRNA (guanosine2251-2'-O)-methyltransferase